VSKKKSQWGAVWGEEGVTPPFRQWRDSEDSDQLKITTPTMKSAVEE